MLLSLLVALFVLCLVGIRFNLKGFNDDYLSKDCTNSIKGIFILLIVISHALPYISQCGYTYSLWGDSLVITILSLFSQLVVVMFLFYSGYGVSESFKRKGKPYVEAMPRHRILGTLLNFDVAVIIYIIFNLLLGNTVTLQQGLLSIIGWETVGNSNWYIFIILLCYLFNYVALRFFSKPVYKVILLFGLCIACIVVLSFYKEYFWYNTILAYPLGFMYSTYKDRIEVRLKQNYWLYAFIVIAVFVSVYMLLIHISPDSFKIAFNLVSILFALLMVMLTMKVRINNKPLQWAGTHLFPIYIYMRLPMIFMETKAPTLVGSYPALFILISLVVTLLIARAYRYFEIKL